MRLAGLHILLTYKCTHECDHCFVWGGSRQTGVLTLDNVVRILKQAKDAAVESIYFEGGEPFLFYPVLVQAVRRAADMGFEVGIVSNAYWAVSAADAVQWLQPFVGRIADLSVSSDLFHCDKYLGDEPQNAITAAKQLDIPTGMISIAQPEETARSSQGQLADESAVMYRGRAAQVLAPQHMDRTWDSLQACPHEDLRDPGRLHVDPFGNLHVCQGLIIDNIFERPLQQILDEFRPDEHPICGPLLEGGPAALFSEFGLEHRPVYADACQMCYEGRLALRSRFPHFLGPDQMYGVTT
jgi:organic radical activating enzyme